MKSNRISNWRYLLPPCALIVAGVVFAMPVLNSGQTSKRRTSNSKRSKPKPSPTPRRALPKPVGLSRGFENFAKRDASARLIAASGTRVIIDPGDHYAEGEKHYKAGRYKEAVAELREAVRLSPDWDDPHYVLALALTELGQLAEAIAEFKQVVEFAIKDEPKILAYYNMGNACFDLGQYDNAIESFRQAIKLDPTLSKPHNNLGLAHAALGKLNEAAAEFAKAVRLKPEYAEAHYNLGVAYLQMGKKNEAQAQQEALVGLKSPLAEKLGDLLKSN
jgi:tetratricopeptide (TPR) repeat protein